MTVSGDSLNTIHCKLSKTDGLTSGGTDGPPAPCKINAQWWPAVHQNVGPLKEFNRLLAIAGNPYGLVSFVIYWVEPQQAP